MANPSPAERPTPQEPCPRDRILAAAERLMGERGYAATGISAICEHSGLPASSIYWHFGSKEGLLGAVMERGARQWLKSLQQSIDAPNDSPPLPALLQHGFTSLKTDPPEFLRLLILLALERSHDDHATLEAVRSIREMGRRAFENALRQTFSNSHPDLADDIARKYSSSALAFAEGCYLAHQLDPDNTDIGELGRHLEFAVLAMAHDFVSSRT
ncbi:TetR/AcrR family transcriptional regulator [Myxococcota bacterium]|nr:TetR/AcrR family transcriptional regulator [Myxococcota bacterium]